MKIIIFEGEPTAKLRCVLLCLLLSAAQAVGASADAARALVWNWTPGQARTYRLEIERRQKTVADRTYNTSLSLRGDMSMTAVAADEDGAVLVLRFDNILLEAGENDRIQRFNSRASIQTDQSDDHPWARAGLAIIGEQYEIQFSECGKIAIIKGVEQILNKVMRDGEPAGPRERLEILQVFGDDGLMNILNSIFNILPRESDDATEWTRHRTIELGRGIAVERAENYRLVSTTSVSAEIGMRAEVEPGHPEGKRIELPQGEIRIVFDQVDIRGFTTFSLEDGCVVQQENSGAMKLDMSIFAAGSNQSERARSELRQTTRLRLLDEARKEER